jgi:2,3-bisphosphoglycerate-dependent phosphoglycerate mutase
MNIIGRKRAVSRLFAIAALAILITIGLAGFSEQEHSLTTIMLVRHAEKAIDGSSNPPLTEAGIARALILPQLVGAADISAIFSSTYKRTQATVQPLADLLELPIIDYDAGDSAALIELIKTKHNGTTVIVSGHSNTIPEIIELFGIKETIVIDDEEYDNFFILSSCSCGELKLLRLRFGAAFVK